jgi:plastocyanin
MRIGTLAAAAVMMSAVAGGIAAARIAPAPKQHVVTMANMSFGKLPAGVKVGDTIVWVNRDTVPHTATARDRSFDVRVGQGQSVKMLVKKAGTIPSSCIFHPAMRATLTVAP